MGFWKVFPSHAFHYSLMLYASPSGFFTWLNKNVTQSKLFHLFFPSINCCCHQLLNPSLKGFETKKWKVIKAKAKLLKKVWNCFTTSYTYLKLVSGVGEEIPLQNICNIENLGNAFLEKREENKFLLLAKRKLYLLQNVCHEAGKKA